MTLRCLGEIRWGEFAVTRQGGLVSAAGGDFFVVEGAEEVWSAVVLDAGNGVAMFFARPTF